MKTPEVIKSPRALQNRMLAERRAGCSVGLVPTMGYLHAGHAALIQRAAAENDIVVVSVFVNPTQFAPTEDLSSYPRDLERDLAVAREAGANFLFHPEAADMYPPGHETAVTVGGLSTRAEGASRPGHFDGVAQVVLMLINAAQPDRVYFGEKDWQQVAVVRRLAKDLLLPAEVVAVPTVRAGSGLALSSRNSYLTPPQQARAAAVAAALRGAQAAYAGGQHSVEALLEGAQRAISAEFSPEEYAPDYLTLLDAEMRPLIGELTPEQALGARLVFAGRVFGVRLIDNMPLVPAP